MSVLKLIDNKAFRDCKILTIRDVSMIHGFSPSQTKKVFIKHLKAFKELSDVFYVSPQDFFALYGKKAREVDGSLLPLLTYSGYSKLASYLGSSSTEAYGQTIDCYFGDTPIENTRPSRFEQQIIAAQKRIEEKVDKLLTERHSSEQMAFDLEFSESRADKKEAEKTMTASELAASMGLLSIKGLPHARFVMAIAKHLKMKTKSPLGYQDEDLVVDYCNNRAASVPQVYFKTKGIQKIKKWFEQNKHLSVPRPSGHAVGSANKKVAGYPIDGINWHVAQ